MSFYQLKRLKYWIEDMLWLIAIVIFGLVLLALLVFFALLVFVATIAGLVAQIALRVITPVRLEKKKCNMLEEKAETESTKKS